MEEFVKCTVVVSTAGDVDAANKFLFFFDLKCEDAGEELDGSKVEQR